uniref:Uncharacterized protein n=1 Tax=Rhizophora mucronata TaxID=61149 RepID=A0A2P2QT77_RHIMU
MEREGLKTMKNLMTAQYHVLNENTN